LIPNPIRKVLSTMTAHRVRALLMGGQACVFYGAAEFSRDIDFAILADAANLDRLKCALDELECELVYVPPLTKDYLRRGHAVHFRCGHPEARDMRVDVMSVMRGVAPFAALWKRRTTIRDRQGSVFDLLALRDLVQAKKTQRDKDWPMIRRLLEADFAAGQSGSTRTRVLFWLRELRTPELLIEAAERWPVLCAKAKRARPLLTFAASRKSVQLVQALEQEEKEEREHDRLYWRPLRAELEQLRHRR
jgi:hypothetical protein